MSGQFVRDELLSHNTGLLYDQLLNVVSTYLRNSGLTDRDKTTICFNALCGLVATFIVFGDEDNRRPENVALARRLDDVLQAIDHFVYQVPAESQSGSNS